MHDRRLFDVGTGRRIALRICLRRIALVERAVRRLLAQRKFEAAVGCLQSRLLQRALQALRVAAEKIERLRPIDREMRIDLTALVDVELDVDAAKLRRIEANVELARAVPGARGDLDRERRSLQ